MANLEGLAGANGHKHEHGHERVSEHHKAGYRSAAHAVHRQREHTAAAWRDDAPATWQRLRKWLRKRADAGRWDTSAATAAALPRQCAGNGGTYRGFRQWMG